MTFTDDFNRADENVEADANWTRVGGVAGDAKIVSNVVKCDTTASTAGAYQCPDQGAGAKYTQSIVGTDNTAEAFLAALRVTDGSNFIGLRNAGAAWQAYKRVTGTFTLLGSYAVVASASDVAYIEEDGSDNFDCKINTVSRITFTDTFNNTETRQGYLPRNTIRNFWLNNFEAGLLAAGNPWYYYAQQ